MAARRLLYLDASGMSAYHWQGGLLFREGLFPADEAGLLAYGDYLLGHQDSLFHLLVDIAEEGFQLEDVPWVQGRDRRALMERKLGQYFYGSPLSTVISLGRLKEGRRDERVLFTGLTGYDRIEPWLQAMRQAGAQLVCLLSMPLVVATTLAGVIPATGQALVVTLGRGGLRQTFFDDGQLRFSRLTTVTGNGIEQVATACVQEVDKIYQYLASQRLIARGTILETLVLCHPSHMMTIRGRCPDTPERRLRLLDLQEQAKKLGLRSPMLDSHSDPLFLHGMLQRPPRQQLAPAADRRPYRRWQARYAFAVAAAVLAVLSLLLAGQQAWRWQELAAENLELKTQLDSQRQRYDGILQGLPETPLSNDDLRSVIDRYESLVRRSPGLKLLLLPLSHGLDRSPGIELERITWRLTAASGAPAARGTPASPGEVSQPSLEVEARLPAATAAAPRSQRQLVEALMADVAESGPVSVQLVSLPVDTGSTKTIKSTDEATTTISPQLFRIRLTQKP